MQSALKFYKAKLHIYDPKSPKKSYSNNQIYKFRSQRCRTQNNTQDYCRTKKSPDQELIFNDSQVRLSIWNLNSNRLQQKQKSLRKSQKKSISQQEKQQKIPSNYLNMMQQKRKLLKEHYIHKYPTKNIAEIHINKLQHSMTQKNDVHLKIGKSPIVSGQLNPKLGYSATFSKRFKQYKRNIGPLQTEQINLKSQQRHHSLSYTLNITDLVNKRSQSLYVKNKVKKSFKTPDSTQNLQAWTDRFHNDDELQIDIISRKNTPQKPKSKGLRRRQIKTLT